VPTFGKAQSNPWCVSNHLSLTRLCWYQEHGWYSTCKKGHCISKNQIKTTRSVVRKTDRPSLSSSSGLLLVTTGQKRSRVVVVPPSQLSCKYRGYSKSESEKGRKATNGVVWSGRRWKKWPSESAATVADLSLLFSEAVWVVVAFSDERLSVSDGERNMVASAYLSSDGWAPAVRGNATRRHGLRPRKIQNGHWTRSIAVV
jgi:hypothetical protein